MSWSPRRASSRFSSTRPIPLLPSLSYGVDLRWCFYRGAYFVDRILRGTPPGELPIEFPTQMFLSINLRTAKALGITIEPMLLGRADEVIE
jgi:putative tryptophan/tyrosine transport system substrate-binding protein